MVERREELGGAKGMPEKDGENWMEATLLHPSPRGNEVKASLGYTARLWVLSVVGR